MHKLRSRYSPHDLGVKLSPCMGSHSNCPDRQQTVINPAAIHVLCQVCPTMLKHLPSDSVSSRHHLWLLTCNQQRQVCYYVYGSTYVINLNCMVKEDTMHSLPDDIHSSKGEGKVGKASTHASTCKYILYKREHNTYV